MSHKKSSKIPIKTMIYGIVQVLMIFFFIFFLVSSYPVYSRLQYPRQEKPVSVKATRGFNNTLEVIWAETIPLPNYSTRAVIQYRQYGLEGWSNILTMSDYFVPVNPSYHPYYWRYNYWGRDQWNLVAIHN